MNQLDLFSLPPPEPIAPDPAPPEPTHHQAHLQAKADFYLTSMHRLAQLMIDDPKPNLKQSRSHEMTRLAELRNAVLAQLNLEIN